MKSAHLIDEVLQAYLLEDIHDENITAHLNVCHMCRKKLEEYKFLINNVQIIEKETFSFDVTTLVMNKITLYEKKKSIKHELIFWGLFIIPVIAISSFCFPFIPNILAIFNSKSILTTLFIVGTGAALMLFLLVDLHKQYKLKERKIFKNNLQPIL